VLGVNVKIDIVVKDRELFIYKEQTFEMVNMSKKPSYCSDPLQKFRIVSLFCGSGGMTGAFVNTQACKSVFAVDIDDPNHNSFDYEEENKEPNYMAW
jgi:hypothetical protein